MTASTRHAEPRPLPSGSLRFAPPAELYRGHRGWTSAPGWLGAIKLHTELVDECRRHGVAVDRFLDVMRALGGYADPRNGRDIAVYHEVIAAQLDCCAKTVQRACRAAEALGVLSRLLTGASMSIQQRDAVWKHYGRHDPRRRQRKLPNMYAAAMPARPAPVGKPGRSVDDAAGNVHQPRRGWVPRISSFDLYSKTTTFSSPCGQLGAVSHQQAQNEAAPRLHRRKSSSGPAVRPSVGVQRFCAGLTASLPGYGRLSYRWIAPGMAKYVHAGLSPASVIAGLHRYLSERRLTWLTAWRPTEQRDQARYLMAMVNRAAAAGHISLIPGERR